MRCKKASRSSRLTRRRDDPRPAGLVDHVDAQLRRLLEFRSRRPGPRRPDPVFADTDPATFAPSASACALASSRLIVSSVPVKTTVLPDTSRCAGLDHEIGRRRPRASRSSHAVMIVRFVKEVAERARRRSARRLSISAKSASCIRVAAHAPLRPRRAARARVTKCLHQVARGDLTDVADAEPEQQPRGVRRALRLDRGEQRIDRLRLPALAARAVRRGARRAGRCRPARRSSRGRGTRPASFRPAPRYRARRGRRNGAAARAAAPGRSARRCSARRPRPVPPPPRCRIPGNGRGRRRPARSSSRVSTLDDLRDDVAGALQHHAVAGPRRPAARSRRGCGASRW